MERFTSAGQRLDALKVDASSLRKTQCIDEIEFVVRRRARHSAVQRSKLTGFGAAREWYRTRDAVTRGSKSGAAPELDDAAL
jgi:hypothetical protein